MKTAPLWLASLLALAPLRVVAQSYDLYPIVKVDGFPRIDVPFTIELDIQNAPGTVDAYGVGVTVVLPASWTFVSCKVESYVRLWNIYDGIYDPYSLSLGSTINGNTIQCNAGHIKAWYYRPIFVTVIPSQAGLFNLQVSVSADGTDSNPGNNLVNQSVLIHSNSLLVHGGSSVSEHSGSNAVFVVELSPPSTSTVSVDYHTLDGTATAGQDYQAVSSNLVFAPGETNLAVLVPVLDDTLEEADSQSFTLQLTNAVNAEISDIAESDFVLDDEPPLHMSVTGNPVVWEGDDGTTNLVFPVQLSGPADVAVEVDYTVGPDPTNYGTFSIPAGATNEPLSVTVPGNVIVQTDRVFQVTLANPRGTPGISLDQAVAQGTILDDDTLPGKFHSMAMAPVASPQIAGRPFPVAVIVTDYYDNPATNFHDTVELVAYARTNYTSHIVGSLDLSNFVDGVGTAMVTYTNAATNAMFVAWKFWGSGFNTASSPSFQVIPPPPLYLSLPATAAEGDGVLTNAGLVSITNTDSQDVLVQLNSGDTQEIVVPPSVLIPAGQTSATFDVTIVDDARLDGTHTSWVTANADGYILSSAGISVQDNESANLSLSLPTNVLEGASAAGTVSSSAAPDFPILVNFTSSDPTQLFVSWGAYIQAGQTSATFTVTARDNKLIDGPRSAAVTAHVPNWTDATAATVIQDNDTNLFVELIFANRVALEGLGTVTNGLRIGLPGVSTNDVVVMLSSSDTTEATVPPEVVVPAGESYVYTNLALPDDNEFDGVQTVTITASAPGFASGTRTFAVYDDDVHHITFGAVDSGQTGGSPIPVSFTLRDVNDMLMTYYPGTISLCAVGAGDGAQTVPGVVSNLLRGSWGGDVVVNGWGTNVQLVATATNGISGFSNPFTLAIPSWATNLQLEIALADSNDLRVFFDTVAGYHYQLEVSTDLTSGSWKPVGSSSVGTGGEMSVLDPATASGRLRFYRMFLAP